MEITRKGVSAEEYARLQYGGAVMVVVRDQVYPRGILTWFYPYYREAQDAAEPIRRGMGGVGSITIKAGGLLDQAGDTVMEDVCTPAASLAGVYVYRNTELFYSMTVAPAPRSRPRHDHRGDHRQQGRR